MSQIVKKFIYNKTNTMSGCSYNPSGTVPTDSTSTNGMRSQNIVACLGTFNNLNAKSMEFQNFRTDNAIMENATVEDTLTTLNLHTGSNVKYYGAVGDGVADDTEAIVEAIEANRRGCVYFPPGTYLITSTIDIIDHVQIRGCEHRFTVIRSSVSPAIRIGINTTANPPNVVMDNITIQTINTYTTGSTILLLNLIGGVWNNVGVITSNMHGILSRPENNQRVAYNVFLNLRMSTTATGANYSITFDAVGSGFSNENRFFGGRFMQNANTVYLVHGLIGNYNSFNGTCLEGNGSNPDVYSAFLGGNTNSYSFFDCRLEGTRGILDESIRLQSLNGFYSNTNLAQTYQVASSAGFAVGDTITGGTSGITAVISEIVNATQIKVIDKSSVNTFTYNETITGAPSGGSTTILDLRFVSNGFKETTGTQTLGQFVFSNALNNRPMVYNVYNGANGWNTVLHNTYSPSGDSNNLLLIGNRATGNAIRYDYIGIPRFSVASGNGAVNTTGSYSVGGTQVVGSQIAGWTSTTGASTPSRSLPTGDATAAELTNAFKQLLADLNTHGLLNVTITP